MKVQAEPVARRISVAVSVAAMAAGMATTAAQASLPVPPSDDVKSVKLAGRTLTVTSKCEANGRVEVRRSGTSRVVASAVSRCVDSRGHGVVRLPVALARDTHDRDGARLVVILKGDGRVSRVPLDVTPPRTTDAPTARAAAWGRTGANCMNGSLRTISVGAKAGAFGGAGYVLGWLESYNPNTGAHNWHVSPQGWQWYPYSSGFNIAWWSVSRGYWFRGAVEVSGRGWDYVPVVVAEVPTSGGQWCWYG